MAGMTLVVGLGVFEDEAVCTLQPVWAFLHTVWPIFEVKAFYTLVWALGVKQNTHTKNKTDEND